MKRRFELLVMGLFVPVCAWSALTIKGTVTDAASGEALINAQVELLGQRTGAATDMNGAYLINASPDGEHTLRASFLGYESASQQLSLQDGRTYTVDFELEAGMISQTEITVVASVAKERETPVAFSNVKKKELQRNLGSRDVPMALETTPGVYASQVGGGSGDARINIRGFNQRNIAVMINGVPVNDMENGWVYWSNWDGLGDVTSSMQVQRGLSAVNLAVPSVGGTMNILTDVAALQPGLRFKTELGNDGFTKKTLSANTGLIDGRFALSTSLVRKVGDGLVQNTWTDAWAYFLGASYILNGDHRFDLYAVGAPQRHGNNYYKRSIDSYSNDYARSENIVRDGGLDEELGVRYNETWGYVGQQTLESWNGEVHDPIHGNKLYARENYYHKPQINLNHYWDISDEMRLSSIVYHSYGVGGGSGPKGNYQMTSDGHIDWDAMIATNQANYMDVTDNDGNVIASGNGATAIIRNSVNIHSWYGLISKLSWDVSEDLKLMAGFDWRTFVGTHYREVRNLLGADFYVRYDNDNVDGPMVLGLGDRWNYNTKNWVDWLGFFAQGEYQVNEKLSTYGMFGTSTVSYEHQNFYLEGEPTIKADDLDPAYTLKGGANYLVNEELNLYGNLGYMTKNPIFDNVINDYSSTRYDDPKNEKIMALEGGLGYSKLDRTVAANVNVYYTSWMDRAWSLSYTSDAGVDYNYNVPGVDATHMGLEIDALWRPVSSFQLKTVLSLGDWTWGSDAESRFSPDEDPTEEETVTLALDGLKVADAPQTTISLSPTWFPKPGIFIGMDIKHAGNYYAAFDPEDRAYDPTSGDTPDRGQSWKVPSRTILDLHAGYNMNLRGLDLEFFGHVYNLTDVEYISDADDGAGHSAANADVFFGLPRTWNIGMAINL